MKSQIQRKKNGAIVELLIPTFFLKKASHEGTKTILCKKNFEEVLLNWRTNDQVMSRFGRTFIINNKCIFQ